MSDRIPGTSYDNPIRYRDYRIFADDCAGTCPPGFAFVHEDYDPTPMYADDPPSDHRHGWERTVEAAKAEIDAQIAGLEDSDRAAVLAPFDLVTKHFFGGHP